MSFEKVERNSEPIGLLRIDVDPDIVAPGQYRQHLEAGIEFGQDTAALSARIARVQGRKLDGDARPFIDPRPCDAVSMT